MPQNPAENPAWEKVALVVGPAALFALALSLCRHADTALAALGAQALGGAVRGFLVAAAAVGLAALAASVRRAVACRRGAWAVAALACMLAGTACLALVAPLGVPVAACAGAGLGAGTAALALLWAEAAAAQEPERLVSHAVWSVLAAGACCLAFRLAPGLSAACACLAVFAVVACGSYLLVRRGLEAGSNPGAPGDEPLLFAMSDGAARLAARAGGRPVRLRDVWRMLWIPLLGIVFCGFIVGLTWDPVASGEQARRVDTIQTPGIAVGACLAVVVLMALLRRAGDAAGRLGLLNRVALPVALAIVLVIPVLQNSVPVQAVNAVCAVLTTAGFAALFVVAVVDLLLAACLTGVGAVPALGGLLVTVAASMGCGLAAIEVLGETGRTVCLVLEAAFLTAIAVSFALNAHGANGSAARAEKSSDDRGRMARCAELARDGGLSQRETQVLEYLARGHGSAFIASELGISENTVRTHARHIYEKLGVSSREELLARVNG